jgi:transposase
MRRCWENKFWRIPEKLWQQMLPLLPKYRPSPKGGRPRVNVRGVADGIFYVLRTGCQWKALPRQFGSPSTVHRYFQEWVERGVFLRLWKHCLKRYDQRKGIGWTWQSMDGAMTKSPLGGEKDRQKPHRSRQAGGQAIGAHRCPWCAAGAGHQRRQHA